MQSIYFPTIRNYISIETTKRRWWTMSSWGMEREIHLTRNTKWTLWGQMTWSIPFLAEGNPWVKSEVVCCCVHTWQHFISRCNRVYIQFSLPRTFSNYVLLWVVEFYMWDNSVIFSAPRTGFYYAQPVIPPNCLFHHFRYDYYWVFGVSERFLPFLFSAMTYSLYIYC